MSDLISCIVHTFKMADVDDVELYAYHPISEWKSSEAGQWVVEHAKEVYWQREINHNTYSYDFIIVAKFSEEDHLFWKLKYQ